MNVLGCTELGKTTTPEEITVAKNNTYVTIDGTKYRVVEKLSDALATNANEILVYAYSANGKLEAVKPVRISASSSEPLTRPSYSTTGTARPPTDSSSSRTPSAS